MFLALTCCLFVVSLAWLVFLIALYRTILDRYWTSWTDWHFYSKQNLQRMSSFGSFVFHHSTNFLTFIMSKPAQCLGNWVEGVGFCNGERLIGFWCGVGFVCQRLVACVQSGLNLVNHEHWGATNARAWLHDRQTRNTTTFSWRKQQKAAHL